MKTIVNKWGYKGLVVRLPRTLCADLGIVEGSVVDLIKNEDNTLTIVVDSSSSNENMDSLQSSFPG